MPIFFGIGVLLGPGIRWAIGYEPVWDHSVWLTIELVTVPLGVLAGIGGFDYWTRYALGAPTRPEDHSGHGARRWQDYFRINTDHKVIGVQYLVTTIVFFVIAGFLAMIFRAELAKPGMQFVDTQTFNGLVSVHASLMIFLFIIPAFAGLGNYVIPLMLGAPDMAFPRLNALSYWLLPIAGLMMVSSFLAPGGAFAAGWTGYAPLSVHQPIGTIFFNMGVQWAGASSIMTALNFLVTIITMRAPGMTFWRMPLLVWANFTTSLLVVIATPFIAGSQFFVLFDRVLHTDFFDPPDGGYVLGYQHIFWFYSHPAVYIMMLPGFGIISEVISGDVPEAGLRLPADGALADGDPRARLLGLGAPHVRGRHGAVAARADDGHVDGDRRPDRDQDLQLARDVMGRAKLHFTTPMLFALGFLSMFVIGGLSGIYLASVPIDIHVSDTYFVVAHIHYVLFGGSLFTIFCGIYYWFPKMTGRMYNERLGKLHFWLTFVGFNATFFPMHYIGTQGMPRRVADYADRFADFNMFISVASFFLGASTIVFLYNMIVSWARGPKAPSNPWHSMTLEWQVSSPPPVFNFDEIPQVVGGPYEYGVPGARHAVFNGDRATRRRRRRCTREPHPRRRERDRRGSAVDRQGEGDGRRGRPRDGARAGARPALGLRRLRRHAPRLGRATSRAHARSLFERPGSPHTGSSWKRIPSTRSRTSSRRTRSTRSSSRRTRSRSPAGCAGTSSTGSGRRRARSPSSTSSPTRRAARRTCS